MHRLELAGGGQEIIPADAVGALYKFGRGRPRLLNTLADNALFEAYLANRQQLTSEDIARAAADLGIGSQPGSTYTAIPMRTAPGAAVRGNVDANEMSALELDQMAESGLEAGSSDMGTSVSPVDLGELVDPVAGDATDSVPEIPHANFEVEGTDELDSAVQEMLSESTSGDELPLFEGRNADDPAGAEATRVAFPNELVSTPLAEVEEEDDLDDLFVELIDE
jgi:hypothetical protein